MNITLASAASFAVICVLLALGFVWDMWHAPRRDDWQSSGDERWRS